MHVYTHARLHDTAIESIGLLRGNSVTSAVTSAFVPGRPMESIADRVRYAIYDIRKRKNPKKNNVLPRVLIVGGTELDFPNDSQGKSKASEKVVPFVVPFGHSFEPSRAPSEPQSQPVDSMLQTIVEAWQWMGEADRALAYGLARRAIGKPVFGVPSNDARTE